MSVMVHSNVPSDALTSEIISPSPQASLLGSGSLAIDTRLLTFSNLSNFNNGLSGLSGLSGGRRRSAGFPSFGNDNILGGSSGNNSKNKNIKHETKRSSLLVPGTKNAHAKGL